MAENDLHGHAQIGDLDAISRAAQSGTNINGKDQFGRTPLHSATADRQADAVHLLLELGADATVRDKGGLTALHYAIEHNLANILELLVRKCPEAVRVSDNHGNQPLWTAAFNARGKYEMVTMLLKCGADPEHRNNVNLCPLDVARRFGDAAMLKLLEDTPWPPRPLGAAIGPEQNEYGTVAEPSLQQEELRESCPGCGTAIGHLHEPFCSRELCPFCGDFVTTCECIFQVLSLNADERKIVEDFEDDSVEPLRSICDSWAAIVEAKGRIPYSVGLR